MARHIFLATLIACGLFGSAASVFAATLESTIVLNNAAVQAYNEAYGSSSDSKAAAIKVEKAEQLLTKALAAARTAKDVCMEATVQRNLAALYETTAYQGYLETTAGLGKVSAETQKKRDAVRGAWSDARFGSCRKSLAARINVYGPALDVAEIDTFENFYQDFRAAVKRGDKQAVAAMFDYPMSIRGAHKRTVRTKADFLKSYDKIITPSAAKALAATSPAALWGRDQGICVGAGAVWLNANMNKKNRFVITSIN
jgi:hypothetical protein